jgi:hypothetical protein
MGVKLAKDTFPSGSGPNDFQCFGPPATKDGDFSVCQLADFGCFQQGEVDSNKYYCAQVCQHRTTKKWFAYFEWGRVGASKPSFQFVECSDQTDAQQEFEDQCHSKNDKRGVWTTIGSLKTLGPKPGKDCYLVRPMATRSVGLPDGRTIKLNDGAKPVSVPITKTATTSAKAQTPAKRADGQTTSLLRDLKIGTVSYARTAIVGNALPSQSAIDEGRTLLQEAQKRVAAVGANISSQVADKSLVQITSVLYSRIPKVKPVGAAPETWILSSNNILAWQNDLDAFESALYSQTQQDDDQGSDEITGFLQRIDMEWIDPNGQLGKFLYQWWPRATGNRHGHISGMKIKNMWKVERHDDRPKIPRWQDRVINDKVKVCDRPLVSTA